MPDETDIQNKGGANGDGSDAGTGAGQGGEGNGAGAGAGQDAGGEEETVTIKKSELEQIKTDRDNYKEGLLRRKAEERDLKGGKEGEGDGKGDEGGEGGASNVIDEKKVGEAAEAAASKVLRSASEKSAKRAFLTAHPEYVDDAQWASLMSHLTFKGGEVTHEEIMDRMEAAILEHKRSTGKLDEYLKAEHERGVREGRIQGELEAGYGTGGAGDRNEGGKGEGQLSEKGKEMARAMHTDPEKAGKVDLSKDNVIDVTKV